jgi:hypothetical protein
VFSNLTAITGFPVFLPPVSGSAAGFAALDELVVLGAARVAELVLEVGVEPPEHPATVSVSSPRPPVSTVRRVVLVIA